MISQIDQTFITILGERFHHDRSSLLPILERVSGREMMVEVGSLCGFATRLFSQYFKNVVSVDPYTPGYDANDLNSNDKRLALARDLFKLRFFDDPSVRQINKTSNEAVANIEDASLDFIYIDAGHNYEAVKEDIEIWRVKLKPGAVMAGDDYDWPGTKQAVHEVLPSHEVISGRWVYTNE